jgi:hypothetical protein
MAGVALLTDVGRAVGCGTAVGSEAGVDDNPQLAEASTMIRINPSGSNRFIVRPLQSVGQARQVTLLCPRLTNLSTWADRWGCTSTTRAIHQAFVPKRDRGGVHQYHHEVFVFWDDDDDDDDDDFVFRGAEAGEQSAGGPASPFKTLPQSHRLMMRLTAARERLILLDLFDAVDVEAEHSPFVAQPATIHEYRLPRWR